MKLKIMQNVLKENGYCLVRTCGSHGVYVKNGSRMHISIPLGKNEINTMMAQRLIKQIRNNS